MKLNFTRIAVLFASAFVLLSLILVYQPILANFDHSFYAHASSRVGVHWIRFQRFITFFGEGALIHPATFVIALLLAYRKRIAVAVWYFMSIELGFFSNAQLKLLFERARPVFLDDTLVLTSFAYPSGHAFGALVFYFTTYFLLVRLEIMRPSFIRALVTGTVVFLIGMSRIYLGAHWSMDVLGGFLWGSAWFFAALSVAERCKLFKAKRA